MGNKCSSDDVDNLQEVIAQEQESSEIAIGVTYKNPMRTELGPAIHPPRPTQAPADPPPPQETNVPAIPHADLAFTNRQLLAKVAQLQAANAALRVVANLARATLEEHNAASKIQVRLLLLFLIFFFLSFPPFLLSPRSCFPLCRGTGTRKSDHVRAPNPIVARVV